jgi:multidrug efflux pump subunit AcrA (membrane-fusion protein)
MLKKVRAPRLYVFLGLVVLLVCAVSVGWAFQHSATADDNEARDGRATMAAGKSQRVVCLGDVDLEHGVTSLSVLQPGRVSEVLVHENDSVAAGAVLLRLDDSVARLQVMEARVALEKAQTRISSAPGSSSKSKPLPPQGSAWRLHAPCWPGSRSCPRSNNSARRNWPPPRMRSSNWKRSKERNAPD